MSKRSERLRTHFPPSVARSGAKKAHPMPKWHPLDIAETLLLLLGFAIIGFLIGVAI